MVFQERLKKLRKENNLTQEQLGKKINVTKVSVSGYESGNRTPDTETLIKIADYFKVTVDYLLGRSDEPLLNEGEYKRALAKYQKWIDELEKMPEEKRKWYLDLIKSNSDDS